jgi:ribosomal protein S18 acetylase RimI-like enzyme
MHSGASLAISAFMIEQQTVSPVIRSMSHADVPAVQSLDGRIQGEEKPEYWQKAIGTKSVALVAESAGTITGFLIGEIRSFEFRQPATGWITAIAVDPDFRGAGIGRRLLAEALDIFRSHGIQNVRTMVESVDRDLLKYFSRMGFTPGPFVELEKKIWR